jgi:hypothetical protein
VQISNVSDDAEKPAQASTDEAVAIVSLYSPPLFGVSAYGKSWTVMPVTGGVQLTGLVA